MTPEQLDHLRAIDAHLTALLDLAAKRTPGVWAVDDKTVIICEPDKHGVADASYCYEDNPPNAAFIAACAGRAEAGWSYTHKRLTRLLDAYNLGVDKDCKILRAFAEVELEEIIAAWPRGLLTLP